MPTNYHLQQTLQSSHAAVFCLAVTEKGNFLASGGSGGTCLWDLRNDRLLKRPSAAGSRGNTTAMIWIRREDDSDEVLVYGTLNGYMACWKQAKNTTDFEELYVLRMVHRVDGNMQLHGVFSVTVNSFNPKAVHFHVNGDSRDVVVFGCHNGKIYFLRGAYGNIMESIDTGGMICPRGNTAMDCEKDVFCLDDPAQDVALYQLSDGVRVKTFPIGATKVPRPRQVAFAENCRAIVSGSDHGIVYVFERRDSNVHQLDTGTEDHIQTVTAANIDGISTIIATCSRDIGKPSRIFIWTNSGQPVAEKATMESWLTWKYIQTICIILLAMSFLYQHFTLLRTLQQRKASLTDEGADSRRFMERK
ncbi:WD40-repeat-containing domain protein [Desarmillaria tabescens]|uniref:WD40-repeat-containing domain protein n=1 Tax=Armillaria tabescens TaxID=1929756 RepID=A0AA39KCL5_ARMTA|nr:WD40-repeat-containing domain protein [Desarmillaria tabescens]KAK0458333.1 WD40-repeat-containing domain protein [Desarmillaria tabescens]